MNKKGIACWLFVAKFAFDAYQDTHRHSSLLLNAALGVEQEGHRWLAGPGVCDAAAAVLAAGRAVLCKVCSAPAQHFSAVFQHRLVL